MQKQHTEDMLNHCPVVTGLIIPVPVHKSRLKKRGFNQTEEFGKRLSVYLGIPMSSEYLIRPKKTAPQKDLGPALRLKNLEQHFSVKNCHQV